MLVCCQVADFYGGPLFEAGFTKSTGDDHNGPGEVGGIVRLLGEVKQGLCRPRAILFKFLGDSVGLQSRLLMVFLQELCFNCCYFWKDQSGHRLSFSFLYTELLKYCIVATGSTAGLYTEQFFDMCKSKQAPFECGDCEWHRPFGGCNATSGLFTAIFAESFSDVSHSRGR